ncbi:MAG: sialidase family protein [Alphaproteobacteria bacterium]
MTDGNGHTGIIESANGIAAWCEERAEALGKQAAVQFRLILLIVVVGVGLILILPPLVGQIDFWTTEKFGGAPANEAVENVERAVGQLEVQVGQSQERFDALGNELAQIQADLDQSSMVRSELVERLSASLSQPFAFWRSQAEDLDDEYDYDIFASLVARDGTIIAVGTSDTSFDGDMIILNSSNGTDWSAANLGDDFDDEFPGVLYGIVQTAEGGFVAVGGEVSEFDTNTVFVARSFDGVNWEAVRPNDAAGELINGTLFTVTLKPDGTLVAGGVEEHEGNGGIELDESASALIMTSPDGQAWTEVAAQTANATRIDSVVLSLVVAPDNALIAFGNKEVRTENARSGEFEIDILRSADGRNWTSVRPLSVTGKPIQGSLFNAQTLSDGSLIAVGREGASFFESRALLLRSKNGVDWSPVRPVDKNGNRIGGSLFGLTRMSNGVVVAAGSESGRGAGGAVLIYSRDGDMWEVVRPEDDFGERVSGTPSALSAVRSNELYVLGESIWQLWIGSDQDGPWKAWSLDGERTDRPELVTDTLNGMVELLSDGTSGYPPGTDLERSLATDTRNRWLQNLDSERRVTALQNDTSNALAQQNDTLASVQGGVEQLSRALTDADELRRASRIATRIAIVALLIYLVQIIVNRYRYLQRISGFYRGRAQAIRLLTASPDAQDILKGVPFTDLMATLSPDSIGFDKSAEPPTQNLVGMFRDAIRPGR